MENTAIRVLTVLNLDNDIIKQVKVENDDYSSTLTNIFSELGIVPDDDSADIISEITNSLNNDKIYYLQDSWMIFQKKIEI